MLELLTSTAIALVAYHHVGYPLLLRAVASNQAGKVAPPRGFAPNGGDAELPSVTLLIPAYNEESMIAAKVMNVLSLDYPADRLHLRIVCDGCSDATYDAAMAASGFDDDALHRVTVVNCMENRGKVAVLNEQIPRCTNDLVALTDASSILAVDALLNAVRHFADPDVGIVSGTYRLLEPGSEGEAAYWRYQTRVRAAEAALGGAIGAHGAFYVLRRAAFLAMPADTINDDFILPMTIVADGGRAVYDTEALAYELDGTGLQADWQRRLRIGAGNLQQALRLAHLLAPRHGGTALAFFSGKFLRAFMPFILLAALLGSAVLAPSHPLWALLAAGQATGYALAGLVHLLPDAPWPGLARKIHYLVQGHAANGLGALNYLLGRHTRPWRRVMA
jgi:cellulose synthase/poly-beta-1,6-N-acetylglucosamine synthase-like glycosyltransferase